MSGRHRVLLARKVRIRRSPLARVCARGLTAGALLVSTLLAGLDRAVGQGFGGGFGFGAVGGISIDADGIVRNVDNAARDDLAKKRRVALAAGQQPAKAGKLRKVSLAGVASAITQYATTRQPLAPEMLLLGGLERVTHVFVDPDRHDVILAGPADTAAIDAAGNIVAAATGRPLLQLEDLLVCLRAIDKARAGGMQCSIDPTPDGLGRLQNFLGGRKTIGPNPDAVLQGMEKALGPQVVSVRGVPGDSRFALVLVAADYRMKRIGMGLEPSGIVALPSYLDMVPVGVKASSLPRFWLEPEYDPIAHDADELAWQLTGRRMKCLTESDVVGRNGVERGKAPTDKTAERWCAAMTANYETLAAKQPVFAELTNCVDLAVVAALIRGRQLDKRAGLDLGPLLDEALLELPTYEPATSVPTVATGAKKGSTWVLTASGGVTCQPWAFAANVQKQPNLGDVRTESLAAKPADAAGFWWD